MNAFFVLRYKEDQSECNLEALQDEASAKQEQRTQLMGELLRSKGFVWLATSNYLMGEWQQAGNILRVEGESPWMCEAREVWEVRVSAAEAISILSLERNP